MKRLPVEDDEVGNSTDLLELVSGCDNGRPVELRR